ncbi:MAG TPA: hypothetical protein VMG10_26070 [Gemmataceae bacterium]|nr:hypothetical protein [Gemmataceae bacterium]
MVDVEKVRPGHALSAPPTDRRAHSTQWRAFIMQVVLEYKSEAANEPCGMCGQPVSSPAGMQLFLAGSSAPVCQDCARKHAPPLAALVHLADAATRIGRINRHSVFPPLTALLDLANAAEKFAQTTSSRAAG